jgi:hypothetical protein
LHLTTRREARLIRFNPINPIWRLLVSSSCDEVERIGVMKREEIEV